MRIRRIPSPRLAGGPLVEADVRLQRSRTTLSSQFVGADWSEVSSSYLRCSPLELEVTLRGKTLRAAVELDATAIAAFADEVFVEGARPIDVDAVFLPDGRRFYAVTKARKSSRSRA